jgi:hypothetical protein
LHREPFALLLVQAEFLDRQGLGRLLARRFDVAKVQRALPDE